MDLLLNAIRLFENNLLLAQNLALVGLVNIFVFFLFFLDCLLIVRTGEEVVHQIIRAVRIEN